MKQILFIALALLMVGLSSSAFGQEKSSWKIKGFLGINQSRYATYLSLGGPGLSWTKAEWEFAIRLLPAIRWDNRNKIGQEPLNILPAVGGGLQWKYRRWVLNAPIGYFVKGKWELAAGLGMFLARPVSKK